MKTLSHKIKRNRRWTTRVVLLSLALVLILPLIPYAIYYTGATADAAAITTAKPGNVPHPGADYWRDVRQRGEPVQGTTQVQGVDTGVLINASGETWRIFRINQLVPYGASLLIGVLLAFLLYFLIRGRIKIEGGRSGQTIERSTLYQRWVHWFTAILFVILALTGLILLYGRWVLIPLLGEAGFAVTASASKEVHNLFGPVFLVALVLMIISFLRDSLINLKVDLNWLLKAGGYLGGTHPDSEKFNAGQKAWYWMAALGGLIIAITGLVLDFPNFEQGRNAMQTAHMLHTGFSIVVIAFFFVHLYLASVGVEGALEGMTRGTVDANWAKQHHNLWYAQVRSEKPDIQEEGGVSPAGVAQPRPGD